MINGDGEMRYKAGGKYNGSWKHGRYDGQGIRKYADGTAYNGSWESGLRHGEGEVIYSDASMYKGGWQHDQVRRSWEEQRLGTCWWGGEGSREGGKLVFSV